MRIYCVLSLKGRSVPAVPFVFHTFVLIDHRPQPRYSLLIRYSNDAHRVNFKRSAQPLGHLGARRDHSIEARRPPRRAVTADADDSVDLGKIEQQRGLQLSVSGEVSHLD